MLMLQGVPQLSGVKQRWGAKKHAILKLNVSIPRK